MKKLLLIFVCPLLFWVPHSTSAQTEQGLNEIRVQISDGLPLTIVSAFTIGLADAFSNSYSDYDIEREDNNAFSGVWSVGYRYYVTPRFNVGGDISYMRNKTDYTLTKGTDVRQGERQNNFYMVMPTAEYLYMNRPKVQLYGNLGVGVLSLSGHSTVTTDRHDYSATTVAFQVNPIGVRFGQRFGGFAELGFGLKGILTAGFSARL